jgi:hypothetical protein
MTAAHVQFLGYREQHDSAQTTTVIQPSSKTVTAGNLIVVAASSYDSVTPTACADNLGNTYSHAEKVTDTHVGTLDVWYCPVTSAGSITSITITHPSQGGRMAIAAEFSGLDATSMVVGGGLAGGDGSTTATWVSDKTIPANGLAVGGAFCSANTFTAGAASGSPSTTIYQSGTSGDTGYGTIVFGYAIAGGSSVTSFTGTSTISAGSYWSGAGAIFSPSSATPTWTTPADTVSMSTTPELKFNSPASAVKQHFYLQLDTSNGFASGDLRTYDSSTTQTNWAYWDGAAWTAMPSDGLPIAKSGNEIRYTVTSALSSATWYRRVRAGTLV